MIEKDPEVITQLEKEYLDPDYIQPVINAIKYIHTTAKALDMGCGCGRSTFELAKHFEKVEGLDFSARFIKTAVELQRRNYLKYVKDEKTKLLEFDTSAMRDRVQFWQADENNLKSVFKEYDFVLYRGNSPHFLSLLHNITDKDAVVVCLDPTIERITGFVKVYKGVFQRV